VDHQSALDNVLGVAGLVNGPVLGLFLVGAVSKRVPQAAAIAGMATSVAVMTCVWLLLSKQVAWPWYPLIGSTVVIVVALGLTPLLPRRAEEPVGEPRAFDIVPTAVAATKEA
jgi:Na+/proline symporter